MAVAAHYLHKTEPFEHQAEVTLAAYGRAYFALFFEQGLGKSKTAIDIASNLYAEGKIDAVLLIAPNGVHAQWDDEQLPEHSPVPYTSYVFHSGMGKREKAEYAAFTESKNMALKWLCVNVECFSYETYVPMFAAFVRKFRTFLIIDEATTVKNPSAARTINIAQGLSDVQKAGKRVISVTPLTKYRAVLTGTPTTNNPYDLYSLGDILCPGMWGMPYFAFRKHYGIERTDRVPGSAKLFTRRISIREMARVKEAAQQEDASLARIGAILGLDVNDVKWIVDHPTITAPYKHLPELKEKIKEWAFIKTKADCLDLPPKVYERVNVYMSPEQRKVYNDLIDELFAEYNGKELTVVNKVSLITRLSQVTGGFFPHTDSVADGESYVPNKGVVPIGKTNPKIEAVLHDIEECTPPLLIAARFTAEVDALYDAISDKFGDDYAIEKIHGGVDRRIRDTRVEAFKNGGVDILVTSSGVISMGYNLQRASTALLYSNNYSLLTREQLEDRLHRIGQGADSVLYKDYVMMDSIDENILASLREKRELLAYMRSDDVREFLGTLARGK